jgi:hypothetical protein
VVCFSIERRAAQWALARVSTRTNSPSTAGGESMGTWT